MSETEAVTNFQREGAISNAHVGRDFEITAMEILKSEGLILYQNFKVPVGVGGKKKLHAFDIGSDNPKTIVECKSHKWTKGNNVPSAKLTVWNEAMYYFAVAPSDYRKIFFVLKDQRKSNGETLAEYYIRTYPHLIPSGVEIWEFEAGTAQARILIPSSTGEEEL